MLTLQISIWAVTDGKLNEKKRSYGQPCTGMQKRGGRAEGEEVVGKAGKYCVEHCRTFSNILQYITHASLITFIHLFLAG